MVLWVLILLCLIAPPEVSAKAAFKSKEAMIKSADVIALVNILRVEEKKTPGKPFDYGQKAIADPINVLKGSLPKNAVFLGDENFICAQVKFKPGRALVFLKKHPGYYTGNNWGLSVRAVTGEKAAEKIDWFDGNNGFSARPQPQAEVLKDIDNILKSMTPSYIEPLTKAKRLTDATIGEGERSTLYPIFIRALADQSLKPETLTDLIKRSTPAGKIYLVMVLMRRDKNSADKILKELEKDSTTLEYQSGCEVFPTTTGKAAHALLTDGKFMDIAPLSK